MVVLDMRETAWPLFLQRRDLEIRPQERLPRGTEIAQADAMPSAGKVSNSFEEWLKNPQKIVGVSEANADFFLTDQIATQELLPLGGS